MTPNLLEWTKIELAEVIGEELRTLVMQQEVNLPNHWFRHEDHMQQVAHRVNLLATNYGRKVSDQVRKVVKTRGTNKLELNWSDTRTFRVVTPGSLNPQRLHLRTENPFSHQQQYISHRGSGGRHHHTIDTGLPLPCWLASTYRSDVKPHLNKQAPGFWQELTSLLLPDSPALTIPNKILTYPHLSEKELDLLKRSERSLNQAVLDAAQIEKVREKVGL
jgi:hypothetical protein